MKKNDMGKSILVNFSNNISVEIGSLITTDSFFEPIKITLYKSDLLKGRKEDAVRWSIVNW